MTLIELIHTLCQTGQRNSAGLWLVPADQIGKETSVITSLPRLVDVVDLRKAALRLVPAGSRFAGIDQAKIVTCLDDALASEARTDCAIVLQLELLLSRLGRGERDSVWMYFRESYIHRPKKIVLAIPCLAVGELIEEDELLNWDQNQRLQRETF